MQQSLLLLIRPLHISIATQAGVDDNDPLKLVKVSSARHWKAISHRLTVNFEGMDLDENKEEDAGHAFDVDAAPRPGHAHRATTPPEFKPSTAQQVQTFHLFLFFFFAYFFRLLPI
jgi:hypothetical protein